MSPTSENHLKAPKSACFVAKMRQVFGFEQIDVIYVKEGTVNLGAPTETRSWLDWKHPPLE